MMACSHTTCGITRVVDPAGFYQDPDPTVEKKPDLAPTLDKQPGSIFCLILTE